MSEPETLESRLDAIEADLTTLKEHGCFDPSHDPDDRLDQLDRELRGLDAEERFDAAFTGAFLFPPPPYGDPEAEILAHVGAWVPGGEE